MTNFTSNTYKMKREILTFSNKISKPDRKFTADMVYGIPADQNCLLTDIVQTLHEPAKKVNSVERLSRHLEKGTSGMTYQTYLKIVKSWVPSEPVIHIDDSDVIKPDGYKFEALGIVRNGAASSSTKSIYKKGYHVTEACVITKSSHPVSIFSKIHSSAEKNYKSANNITFEAWKQALHFSEKPLFPWIVVMMTIKCSLS